MTSDDPEPREIRRPSGTEKLKILWQVKSRREKPL
jgi:hypothetical protein